MLSREAQINGAYDVESLCRELPWRLGELNRREETASQSDAVPCKIASAVSSGTETTIEPNFRTCLNQTGPNC